MPIDQNIKKVLVIGSGPIVIGQAAEFDYSGAQACRVLKNEGIEVVLVNSNPATIMTDKALADHIYLEPLTVDTLKRIILKEKPDSILAGLGGQTGLTMAMELSKGTFLEDNNCRLLGTKIDAILKAEDRDLFKKTMESINQPLIPSDIANDIEHAKKIALEIGYPVIIRPAFTLGGAGGGVAYNEEEFVTIASNGLLLSPITQILVEKYIFGYKEIEFEVMRDKLGNRITVCSMENFDPVGVHTGDSIVVAPTLTLSDKEYQMLRTAALDIIEELKIEGGCNCQFALNPDSFDYAVIEVNPRVSRSSALASKATGYPIAKVAVKIALGYTLDEIKNDVTKKTCACFEPALDYVVVKFPKWPFDKFVYATKTLGTQMKATGEVMAIGNSFEMAIMKAVRGAEIKLDSLNAKINDNDLLEALKRVDDSRLFVIFKALKNNISVDQIHNITRIDKWFLYRLENLAKYELMLESKNLDSDYYLKGKRLGYLDSTLERITGKKVPFEYQTNYKMVDTCASEFKAVTPYFYSSFSNHCEARDFILDNKNKKVLVLGSGPIRIGQGIEFDYSSVHSVWTLKELGYEVIIINNNPETVSTDFDTADRLYFEPLTFEDVMNVIKVEKPFGVVVSFGGQTAIKLVNKLNDAGINILGTSANSVDIAEDRERFDELLEEYQIKRPKGFGVFTKEEALEKANLLGYPVLVRPSYVIGGQNMIIAYTDNDVIQYMDLILQTKNDNPILVDKYMMGTEMEVDAISDGEDVLIPSIMQHIERAGVHSGDSITVYPPHNMNDIMLKKIVECSTLLAKSLKTKGLINIQYVVYQNELYVIEVNPRASRTIPYISKVTGIPMVDIATKIMMGSTLKELGYKSGLGDIPPYVSVKVPVFSFEKINDANSLLGPEMKSTGEVLGVGKTLTEALFKGLVSAGFKIKHLTKATSHGVFVSVKDNDLLEVVSIVKKFSDLGINIYATPKTAEAVRGLGIDVFEVGKISKSNEAFELLENGKIDYIIYTCDSGNKAIDHYTRLHKRALQLSIASLTSLDTANALADILASRFTEFNTELVDINNLRTERKKIHFVKMQGSSNDYIFINNFDSSITCPESLAINFADRHTGIGGDGLVLIEKSEVADARMRIFNLDGTEGKMAGNCIRCVGKYLYDNKFVNKEDILVETASGIKKLKLFIYNNTVRYVSVNMGKAILSSKMIPVISDKEEVINEKMNINKMEYNVTCVSIGNPHAVVFVDRVDNFDVTNIGPQFENNSSFPERVNTEFIRVVNKNTIKMRVWERGNGETMACGTGACAAVVAACLNGYCNKGEDIVVKVKGGDLIVNYTDEAIYLTGNADIIYEGFIEY